jgi:DNA primase catalytic subunit
MTVMFTYNLSVLLKIRVYRQKISPIHNSWRQQNIRLSAQHLGFLQKHISVIGDYSLLVNMAKYKLPRGMCYSTLQERKQFYTTEFSLPKVQQWLEQHKGKVKFAAVIGRHTKIYLEKYRKDAGTTIIIDEYKGLDDVQDYLIEFLPEAAYYDRNGYDANDRKAGQELAFDLDPENITCPIHGTLADKMRRHQGLSVCRLELELVKEQALSLYEHLEHQFSRMKIVYSGRGFHIHVFDPEAYALNTKQRRHLGQKVKEKGFQIDEWVTAGDMRLIRLPYSLHGLVSRVAIPVEKSELDRFDPIHDKRCLPSFLDSTVTS